MIQSKSKTGSVECQPSISESAEKANVTRFVRRPRLSAAEIDPQGYQRSGTKTSHRFRIGGEDVTITGNADFASGPKLPLTMPSVARPLVPHQTGAIEITFDGDSDHRQVRIVLDGLLRHRGVLSARAMEMAPNCCDAGNAPLSARHDPTETTSDSSGHCCERRPNVTVEAYSCRYGCRAPLPNVARLGEQRHVERSRSAQRLETTR